MWLLDWLVVNYYKVLDWFGDGYVNFRNTVANFPYTISQVYSNIVTYYYSAISAANAAISNFYSSNIVPWINYLQAGITNVRNTANNYYNDFVRFTNDLPNTFHNWYLQTISYIRGIYDTVVADIRANLTKIWNVDLPDIWHKLSLLFPFATWLSTAATNINVGNVQNLVNDFNSLKGTLIAFTSNPVGFIIGMLQADLIRLISFLIAYGLGTVKYSLPPMPIWGKPNPANIGPIPPGNGLLVKPLASMYVSGNTFGPGHYGTDFGLSMGDAVYAAHDGVVTVASFSNVGYGNQIDIDGGNLWSRYGHLESYAVVVGQRVIAGSIIGYGDSTGNSTGPHLHFELKINGVYVDPVGYF